MSVRKRVWRSNGERRGAWVGDYADQHGKRHLRTFARRREADAYQAAVKGEVRAGPHIADSDSVTVAEAGRLWITSGETAGLERATMETYRLLLDLHVIPLIGGVKLSQLTGPMVRAFEDRLHVDRSPMMTRKAVKALGAIIADAQERGLATQNVVRSLRTHRRRGNRREARQGKLKVGVNIPSPDEIRTLIPHLS